jgi:hypothetical protein
MPGRTAASASNSQEIDVYLLLQLGTYFYNPFAHALLPVAAADIRRLAIVDTGLIAANTQPGGDQSAASRALSNASSSSASMGLLAIRNRGSRGTSFIAEDVSPVIRTAFGETPRVSLMAVIS